MANAVDHRDKQGFESSIIVLARQPSFGLARSIWYFMQAKRQTKIAIKVGFSGVVAGVRLRGHYRPVLNTETATAAGEPVGEPSVAGGSGRPHLHAPHCSLP